jgi:hypothetical protein
MTRKSYHNRAYDNTDIIAEMEEKHQQEFEAKHLRIEEKEEQFTQNMDSAMDVYHDIMDTRLNYGILGKCKFTDFFDFITNPRRYVNRRDATRPWHQDNHLELKEHHNVIKQVSTANIDQWVMFAYTFSQM